MTVTRGGWALCFFWRGKVRPLLFFSAFTFSCHRQVPLPMHLALVSAPPGPRLPSPLAALVGPFPAYLYWRKRVYAMTR